MGCQIRYFRGWKTPIWPGNATARTSPIFDLWSHWASSWHRVLVSGNVVLFYPVGLARNPRTLVWLNDKNGCFCGIRGALEVVEMNVQKCGKVGLGLCQETREWLCLILSLIKKQMHPDCHHYPFHHIIKVILFTIQNEVVSLLLSCKGSWDRTFFLGGS